MHFKFFTFVFLLVPCVSISFGQEVQDVENNRLSLHYVYKDLKYHNSIGGGGNGVLLAWNFKFWLLASSSTPFNPIKPTPLRNIFSEFDLTTKFPDYHSDWFHPSEGLGVLNEKTAEEWSRNVSANAKSKYIKLTSGLQLADMHTRVWFVAKKPKDYQRSNLLCVMSSVTIDQALPKFTYDLTKMTIPAHDICSTPVDVKPGRLTKLVDNAVTEIKFEKNYKEDRFAFLLPVEVAVDADRDGEITFDQKDKTTYQKPYFFWVNDDRDIENSVDGGDLEEDDIDSYANDCDQPGLEYRRDLEDLTRLWIDFSGISQLFPATDLTVALKVRIESESGDPRITFYQPVESDGGRQYLQNETTGSNQLQGTYGQELCRVSGTASVEIPRRAWETLPADKVVHLLLEGAKSGDAQMIFEIWKDSKHICDLPTVHIALKNVEDMYETWTVGDVDNEGIDFGKLPALVAIPTSGQNLPAPATDVEKDYIMFVHGWNMAPWEKEAYASTMFKRMWHQGYKGRFGAFRWPTFWGLTGPSWGDPNGENFHPAHFNGSEQRAWNSASRLKALIENRASVFGLNKIRLYAHSMGNIVCGEALRQFGSSGLPAYSSSQAPVHSYIAAQAAISSHVYDRTTTPRKVTYLNEMPNIYGYFWQAGASDWPPQWEIDCRPSYMDPKYLPANVTYINHYNFDDYALNGARWPLNQDLKAGPNYFYTTQGILGGHLTDRFIHSPYTIFSDKVLNCPTDRYEIFSYAADSAANALGKIGTTCGKFSRRVDVVPLLVYDGNAKAHKYHSGQFRSTIQKRWEYWKTALDNMIITIPAQ